MQQESQKPQSTKPSTEPGDTSAPKKKTRKRSTSAKSKGLGDTIAKVTEATGIDKVVKAVAGDDCGCDKRRERLNKMFPYATGMTEEGKNTYEKVLKPAAARNRFTVKEQNVLNTLYGQVYGKRPTNTSCSSCVIERYKKLTTAYEAYCEE